MRGFVERPCDARTSSVLSLNRSRESCLDKGSLASHRERVAIITFDGSQRYTESPRALVLSRVMLNGTVPDGVRLRQTLVGLDPSRRAAAGQPDPPHCITEACALPPLIRGATYPAGKHASVPQLPCSLGLSWPLVTSRILDPRCTATVDPVGCRSMHTAPRHDQRNLLHRLPAEPVAGA
jgi:hypothetical protein